MSDMAVLDRAIFLGLVTAVVVALVGTTIVFAGWRWASRRTEMQVLAGFITALALLAVYILSVTRLVSGAYEFKRAGQAEADFMSTAYVHPGSIAKLAPFGTIAVTWLVLIGTARLYERRAGRGPTPRSS